ncbi:MAG: TolC family protein [Nitrospirae bacterium]|nr:TolC family protein [Nitrospirota bacterium]
MTRSPRCARWALCLPIALVAALAGPAWGAEALTLNRALAAALSNNQLLVAAQATAAALGEVPARAGALPDPSLQLAAMSLPVDSLALDREPMTQIQVGIGQVFPFPGRRALEVDAARHASLVAAADGRELRREVARDVTEAWWRLFYLDRALEIVGHNQEPLHLFTDIARTKYALGKGLQQDVLLADVELAKLLEMGLALDGERAQAAARLSRLMGWPAGQEIRLPEQVDTDLPEVPDVDHLVSLAGWTRPMLTGAVSATEQARVELDLARRAHLPDFMVNAAYGFRSGHEPDGSPWPDLATVMLTFNVPIDRDGRQDRLVAQRLREFEAAQAARQAARDQVREEIATAHATYRAARERTRLLSTGIIPLSQQTVASMRAGYQVGGVDFSNLVQAQVTLHDYETRYWELLSQAKAALGRLEAAVGEPLPSGMMGEEEQ